MPPWTVTLICGASGVGKSRVPIPLARRYGVPMGEADDVVTALKALTTGREQPALHYSDSHPETRSWPADRIAALHLEVAEALRAGYEAVIADHVAFRAPVLLEGDYLIPELAFEFSGSVRAVVVCEPDEDQVVANYLAREPEPGEQRLRARVTARIQTLLVQRACKCRVPVVPARPWASGPERVDQALRGAHR